jgi:hypothetical protein
MWILFLLLFCGVANADVYVTTNSSGNVYDISDQPDAVIPSGDTRTVLKGQLIQNLPIVTPYQQYNFSNGNFTLNTTAVQAQQAAQTAAIAQQTAAAQAKASAIAKLTDAISKVATQDVLTQSELDSLLPGS